MKKDLEKMKEHLGTWPEVAKSLGISDRLLRYIKSGSIQPRGPLRQLIKIKANSYRNIERV